MTSATTCWMLWLWLALLPLRLLCLSSWVAACTSFHDPVGASVSQRSLGLPRPRHPLGLAVYPL
eukprot:11153777-Prorocentrum_lima.AAC.1